jgi:cytochrome c553
MKEFGLALTLVWTGSRSAACEEGPALTAGPQLLEALAVGEMAGSTGRAVIVDGGGIIRFDDSFEASNAGLKEIAAKLVSWEQGRQAFSVHCGHCHDDDGANTSYVGIKTLAGISTRMSDNAIVAGGEQFGAVPISTWQKHEIESLLIFIRGL